MTELPESVRVGIRKVARNIFQSQAPGPEIRWGHCWICDVTLTKTVAIITDALAPVLAGIVEAAIEAEHIRCLNVVEQQIEEYTGPTGGWLCSAKEMFSKIALYMLCNVETNALARHDAELRDAVLAEGLALAVKECHRHWLFLKHERDNGANFEHMNTRMVEAEYLEGKILAIALLAGRSA